MEFYDQLHRKLEIAIPPKRIVSLVPSQTELLVDLGLENSIVGVTKFCVHPKHLRKDKVVVGGTKSVHIEKIKHLQPHIILCNKEENTLDMVKRLEGIAPIHISDVCKVEDCYALIEMYGSMFHKIQKAKTLTASIQKLRDKFKSRIPTQKVAYFIWKDPWMIAASDTFINTMLNEAGFENAFKDEIRYPEINLNHPKLKESDALFLSSEPFPFKEKHVLELQKRFPMKKISVVDGELFSWYGSRLLKAYPYFESLQKEQQKSRYS